MVKFLNGTGLQQLVALIKSALNDKQDILLPITDTEIDAIIDGSFETLVPVAGIGLVTSLDSNQKTLINIDYMGSTATTSYPQTSTRATLLVPVNEKFAMLPIEKIWHNPDSGGTAESDFIDNDVLRKYTFLQMKDVNMVLIRRLNSAKVQAYSVGVGSYDQLTSTGTLLDKNVIDWSWLTNTTPTLLNIKGNAYNYNTENTYMLVSNFKRNDSATFAAPEYRKDFDLIIVPNTWNLERTMEQKDFISYFPNQGEQWGGGMDIYGDYIVQTFTTGRILVMDKASKEVIAVGAMDVAASNMHCNAVSFGNTIPDGCEVPYLYVSQWVTGNCHCHVMKLSWDNGIVTCNRVQKISYTGSKFNSSLNWDWSVDAETGYLWCYGYSASATDRFGEKTFIKFALPELSSSQVTLTDSNAISSSDLTFNGLMQDTHIENDTMFYLFGYDNANYLGGVLIIDLSTMSALSNGIISMVDTGYELEGITRVDNKLVVTTHTPNHNTYDMGIYEIDLLQSNT